MLEVELVRQDEDTFEDARERPAAEAPEDATTPLKELAEHHSFPLFDVIPLSG